MHRGRQSPIWPAYDLSSTRWNALKLRPKTVDSWPDFVASKHRLAITIAPLDEGLLLDDPALALIAESPLFGQRVMQRRRRENAPTPTTMR